MSRLYLIRHGKPAATWGDADEDPGLDAAGQAQANAVRDVLLALTGEDRPTRVVSSPLRRCIETARPTAEALGIEIEIDPSVGEIPTPKALAAADQQVSGTLVRLFALSEAYPDLKADATMQSLMEELSSTENKVAFARQAFNDAVMFYNNAIESFPSNIIANNFSFKAATMLESTESPEERKAIKVAFT